MVSRYDIGSKRPDVKGSVATERLSVELSNSQIGKVSQGLFVCITPERRLNPKSHNSGVLNCRIC